MAEVDGDDVINMDAQQFRAAAHQTIDYVIDYLENIRSRYLNWTTIK